MTLFQIGEKIVYPNHGIGTVENISTRSFGAQAERFYLLRLTYTSMTVMVPFSHVTEIGLRKVTRNGEVARVLGYLAEECFKRKCDWKDRFKENSDRMRNGSLLEIAEVLKTLAGAADREAAFLPRKENAGPRPPHADHRTLHLARLARMRSCGTD